MVHRIIKEKRRRAGGTQRGRLRSLGRGRCSLHPSVSYVPEARPGKGAGTGAGAKVGAGAEAGAGGIWAGAGTKTVSGTISEHRTGWIGQLTSGGGSGRGAAGAGCPIERGTGRGKDVFVPPQNFHAEFSSHPNRPTVAYYLDKYLRQKHKI